MADFGVLMFSTEYAIPPVQLAQAAEARGFESVFFPEHTHIPTSRRSPWPGGEELPREYWHTIDPFVALAAAASATREIKLGTGIALVTERDPILMAKQVASLDVLSGGRVLLGVGAGWNAEEMEDHGTRFADRWKVLRERVLAMKTIWREDEPEFHGEFVDFDPMWAYPKPISPGGPPVLLGASSRWAWDRIAEYCDGWMPICAGPDGTRSHSGIGYGEGIAAVRAACEARGRDPDEMQFSIFGVPPDPDLVAALIEAGFGRVIFALPAADADTVIPLLDRYTDIAASFSSSP